MKRVINCNGSNLKVNNDILQHNNKTIVMIGAGHVASNMALALVQQGYTISGVYSRTIEHAQILAHKTNARAFDSLQDVPANAALYIISVVDDAIKEVAEGLNHVSGVLAHTSGSTNLDVLADQADHYGVLYPLQTFNKDNPMDFASIPLFIEASGEPARKLLQGLAENLSDKVIELSSVDRMKMHVAAVFACNFSQYMATMAAKLMNDADIDYALLFPLIRQTMEKMMTGNPAQYQTGPAVRGDQKTIRKHIDLLADDEKMMKLYSFVSDHINHFHNSSE